MRKLKRVLSCNDARDRTYTPLHEPDQLAIRDVKWLLHNRPAREVVHFDDDIFVSRHTHKRGPTRYNIWDLENGKIIARDANAFTWWPNLLVAAWFAVDTTDERPAGVSAVYTKSIVICSTYTCKNAPRIVLDDRPELLPQVNITCLGVADCDHAFCHARRVHVDEPPCLRYRVELFYAGGASEVLEVIV